MQPKFTLPKKGKFLFLPILVLLMVCSVTVTKAQTTISTSGFTNNNGFGLVTFNFRNNNASGVILTGFSSVVSFTGNVDVAVFVKTSAISGSPGAINAGNGWNQQGSATISGVANTTTTTTQPFLSGLNILVPAGATYGIAIQARQGGGGAGCLRYSTIAAGTYTFSGGGCDILTGTGIGFAGDVAPAIPGNTPRGYIGSVTFISAVPCTGTPSPGNTISSSALACPGAPFTLSLQNSTPGTGVTYQWERAAASAGPWTPISGATSATYAASQTAATWYRCQVTCSGNTGTSTALQVGMNNIDNCYCTPVYTNGCGFGDYIARVQMGTLNNASTCSAPPYTFYNAVAAPVLIQGATYPLSITVGPDTFGQRCAAWIDYNRDGDFNDAGEFLGSSGDPGANGTAVINVTIPAGTNIGTTRMRVRGGDDNPTSPTAGQSCGATASTFGEAEDYNVNIQPCVPFANVTGPANATVQCSANATFTLNIGSASLPSIGWEYRTSAAGTWQNVINGVGPGGVVIAGATTNTITLTGVPSSITGYQFRAYYSNPCTAIDFSSVATLTVTPLVATVNPTSQTICRGTILPLSLTNTTSNTVIFNESFTGAGLPAGWAVQNLSSPLGPTGWFKPAAPPIFPARVGNATDYVAANWQNTTTTGSGTISNWLFTPQVTLKNGDFLTFWTRTVSPAQFPDRLQVRLSTNGASTNVGATATSTGDFSTMLLEINPTLTTTGYPTSWTQYTVTVSGVPTPTSGRLAFRYFVTDGGGNGANSDFIGIDDIAFTSLGAFGQGVWSGPAGTMWTDAGATVAYTGDARTTIYVNPTANASYSVVYTTGAPLPVCVSNPTVIPVTVLQPLGTVVQPVDRSVCVGGTTTFAVTAPGGPFGYQWQESRNNGLTWANVTNGGVYSGATTSTLTLTGVTRSAPLDMNNFLYRVNVTTSPCTGSFTSSVVKLTVNALPTVTIAASDLALLPNQTSTITGSSTPAPNATPNWAWTRDGSPIVGSTNSVVADIDRLGVYQATVTDINGCRNSSNQLLIEAEAGEKLWLYPNPTSGQFQIRLYYPGVTSEKRRIQIFNSAGSEVMSRDIMLSNVTSPHYQRFDIDLSMQPAGIYLVKVIDMYSKKAVSGFVIKQAK